MKRFFALSVLLTVFGFGCGGSAPVAQESELYVPAGGWPICSTTLGNPEGPATMDDTKTACSSCDLVSPCSNSYTGGTTYSWYSPKICSRCASNCPSNTAVGNFCTTYYGGACTVASSDAYGNALTYLCGNGLTYTATTYAAYGMSPSASAAYCGSGPYTNIAGGISYYAPCP